MFGPRELETAAEALTYRDKILAASTDAARFRLLDTAYARLKKIQEEHVKQEGIVVRCPAVGGCWMCCCELTEVGKLEAARVASHIQQMERGDVLKRRLATWLEAFRVYSGTQIDTHVYIQQKLVCPFLDPAVNLCEVYSVRPAVCRTYVGIDEPERCHEAHQTGALASLLQPKFVGTVVFVALAFEGATTHVFPEAVAHYLGVLPYRLPVQHHVGPIAQAIELAVQATREVS